MEQAGIPEQQFEEYIKHLERCGRGSYRVRSYRLGLTDFSRWLQRAGREIDVVSRRAARTVNHRLSVLASFFAFLIDRDTEDGGTWAGRVSPVPARAAELTHSMGGGGDAPPRRKRAELRRRESRELPAVLDPVEVERLVGAARSWRDKALLMLLSRSGQRIGDWSVEHGRHGVLGMSMADLDRRASTIVVRLKGARDEHRVRVTEEFWGLFDRYLEHERRDAPGAAAWVGLRCGWPNPLTYGAFEAGLRQLAGRTAIEVTAHMFATPWLRGWCPLPGWPPLSSCWGIGTSRQPSIPMPTSMSRRWSRRSGRSSGRPVPRLRTPVAGLPPGRQDGSVLPSMCFITTPRRWPSWRRWPRPAQRPLRPPRRPARRGDPRHDGRGHPAGTTTRCDFL